MSKAKINAYQAGESEVKKILAVVKSQSLICELEEMAQKELAQLQLARANTPDLFILPANVKVVNRRFLGLESWQFYCERLKEGYNYLENTTPLIIVDQNLKNSYENLKLQDKQIRYIKQKELIVKTARDFLRKSEMKCGGVRAVDEKELRTKEDS